ncbi:glycosyltransferase [Pseudonocardia xinjiangensis]|uniref:glycosyltransferase n=1 Tax=Pseudonocardia xinjiangensis TaxID=75289 RepID=UPI003D8FECE6
MATGDSLADDLDRFGVPHRSMPGMLAPTQLADDPDYARSLGFHPDGKPLPELEELGRGAVVGRIFAGLAAERAATDMLALSSDFRPDIVVRESTEFGGYLTAESLGVPCVTLDAAPLQVTRDPGMLPWLNESRVAIGLPPVNDTSTLTRHPWISWMPDLWHPADTQSAAHRYYRGPDEASDPLDPAIAQLPAGGPFVVATLGSVSGHMLTSDTSPLRRIVEALGSLPCTAVVALGRGSDVSTWAGPRPANVHLASFVQQPLLLQACDLFVTHAGFGGVREALTAGVPMVALPLYAEQPANAQRLTELGLGVTVDAHEAGTTTIAAACREVLDDPSYRFAARAFRRRLLGLPTISQLVADLTALGI